MGKQIPWTAIQKYSEYLGLDDDESEYFIQAMRSANDVIIEAQGTKTLTVAALDGQINGIA